MKCFLSTIATLVTFFCANPLQGAEIPMTEMPPIVAEQFAPFIQTAEIRSFLNLMKVDSANGGVKVFGSTVFAQIHPDIKTGDVDLIAISPSPRKSIIEIHFAESCAGSDWKLIKARNRTLTNLYGSYTGAHASFKNQTSHVTIDIFFLNEDNFNQKHDPVFVASAKVLEYFEKGVEREPFFRANYIQPEEFGGRENIDYQIQNKILHVPRYHGNDAIFFRMVYTLFKHGFTLANRLTLERALLFLSQSKRSYRSLKLLSDKKARESGNPVKYYSLMSSLLSYSYLASPLEEYSGLKAYYRDCLKGLRVEELQNLEGFFFRPKTTELINLPEFMRRDKAYSLYFLKKYYALNQQKYKDPIHLRVKEFFADPENLKLSPFVNLNKAAKLSEKSKSLFSNPSKVFVRSAVELYGKVLLCLTTRTGTVRFEFDPDKKRDDINIAGIKYTINPSKFKIAITPNQNRSGKLLLADLTSFLLPQHEIKTFTGPLSYLIEEQGGSIVAPQSIHDFLKDYGTRTFKLDALADLELINAQKLLDTEFSEKLLKDTNNWVKSYKKKLKKQRQKKSQKQKKKEKAQTPTHEEAGAATAPLAPAHRYQEYMKKWRKAVSKNRKVLINELKEYSADLLTLMKIEETVKGIEIAHAAEERYRQFAKQTLVRKSSKKINPGQDDLLINFLYFKSSFLLVLFHLQNHVEEGQEILNQYTLKTAEFLIYGEDKVGSAKSHPALKILDEPVSTHLERKKLTRIFGGRRFFGFLVLRKIFNSMVSHYEDALKYNSRYMTIYNQFIRELFPYYLEVFTQLNREAINLRLTLGTDEMDAPLQTVLNYHHHSLSCIVDACFF